MANIIGVNQIIPNKLMLGDYLSLEYAKNYLITDYQNSFSKYQNTLDSFNIQGYKETGLSATPNIFKYYLSGDIKDANEGYLQIKGKSLPTARTQWKINSTTIINEIYITDGDLFASITGSFKTINGVQVGNIKSISMGDSLSSFKVLGNLSITENRTFSGEINSVEYRWLYAEGMYYKAKFNFSLSSSYFSIKSISLIDGNNKAIFDINNLAIKIDEYGNLLNTDNTIFNGTYWDYITSGNDNISGTNQADTLWGGGGNDSIKGLFGNDVIDGGAGEDKMYGGSGNDTYYVDSIKDTVVENTKGGEDLVVSLTNFTLPANIENLSLTGTNNTFAYGNSLNNQITGNDGNNIIKGMSGMDILKGLGGNDTISGGLGNDVLTGGLGNDIFLFNSKLGNSNVDIITDFSSGDRISLDRLIFNSFTTYGTLAQSALYQAKDATSAHDADDRVIYNTSTGDVYYDADGLGSKYQAIKFAKVAINNESENPYSLTSSNFLVI